jgi:hypothetical protein
MKSQIPMTKEFVVNRLGIAVRLNIEHWGLGFDLAFDIGHWTLGFYLKSESP